MSGGRSFPLRAAWPLVAFPVAKLAIHLATIGGYGIFRDELYYLACSRRLAWGYVDQPPFSIALLAIQRGLFGESLFALRILPALAGAGIVLVVGLMTRRFGGGALAQSIAMACALAAPHALAIHHFYSMNAFDGLVWALAAWLLVDLLAEPERRTRGWLALGALLGSGLLNKVSVLWLGAGMAVGLALSPARRSLRTPGPWLAAVLALLVFLPHLAWQAANGWPTLEFIANATGEKMAHISPGAFLLRQVEMMNSFSVIIWTGGLVWLARKPQWRALAWIWLTVLVILVVNGASRPGYLAPAYAWLFAAGGVGWESEIDRRPWFSRVRWALPVAVLAFGALFAPLALPLLSVERYVAYAARMGQAPSTDERKQLGELPQFFADMHGWRELAVEVERVWSSLPAAERTATAVFTSNYGEAGAVERFATDPALRAAAISGHNSYWLWGPGEREISTVVAVNGDREGLARHFPEVTLAGSVDCGHCMPYENGAPIWIARGPVTDLRRIWLRAKHFD